MCWADFTTLCRALRFREVQLPYQAGVAASQDALYGATVEIAENPGIHVEPPQPAEEEEPLPGRLPDGVCVVGPGQVVPDVDPEEPEAADTLHRSPVDGEGGVFYSLSLPVVHDQHLYFADVEKQVVVLTPRCRGSDLLSVGLLIVASDQAYDGRVISKLNDGAVGEQGGQARTEHAALRESGWRMWCCLSAPPVVCPSGSSESNHGGRYWAQGLWAWWRASGERWCWMLNCCQWTAFSHCVPLVQVGEGSVEGEGDGICSWPIWPVGKLKRVQRVREGGGDEGFD